jgi:copper chaperone CopZ
MKKITLNVKGMHCSSCEALVKDALEEQDGIVSAEVSNEKGTAVVAFDEDSAGKDLIIAVIRAEGYDVKL